MWSRGHVLSEVFWGYWRLLLTQEEELEINPALSDVTDGALPRESQTDCLELGCAFELPILSRGEARPLFLIVAS